MVEIVWGVMGQFWGFVPAELRTLAGVFDLFFSALDRLVTLGLAGAVLLIYSWWSGRGPRQTVLRQLSENLAGAITIVDRLSQQSELEERRRLLVILADYFRVVCRISDSSDLYFRKGRTIFLKQIATEADTRYAAIHREIEELAEVGLMGKTHTSIDMDRRGAKSSTTSYEHFLIGTLYKLNLFLKLYGKGHNVDFVMKSDRKTGKELMKYWRRQTVELSA